MHFVHVRSLQVWLQEDVQHSRRLEFGGARPCEAWTDGWYVDLDLRVLESKGHRRFWQQSGLFAFDLCIRLLSSSVFKAAPSKGPGAPLHVSAGAQSAFTGILESLLVNKQAKFEKV